MNKAAATSVLLRATVSLLLAFSTAAARAQDGNDVLAASGPPPRPPRNLVAKDHALDGGVRIDLTWNLSPDDRALTDEEKALNEERPPAEQIPKPVSHYRILRAAERDGAFRLAGEAVPDEWAFRRGAMTHIVQNCDRGEDYWFKVVAVGADGARSEPAGPEGPVRAVRQFFDGSPKSVGGRFWIAGRFWLALITITICGAVIFWINHARKGKPLNVRKIAGLEAVDEAVGRATEMGRSCLFVPGIQDMNDIQTIAGLTVLARVSRTAARYEAKVEVPTARSLVMTTARETVHAAFLEAGRPDAYNQDLIYYVTDEQFGFVAYLQGMMVREKPAACFYMGTFFAESLILAETGNSIGAIQVAGTAMPAQLPFFVAACDYTLIGEEFFAASAYLSGEPDQLGSLKGQDLGKVIVALGLLVGVLGATVASLTDADAFVLFTEFFKKVVME
ncbi:MAG: DUF6754 domain-containing protein [Planctomycetota bacterium]|jgi:hypothetical protein